MLGFADLPRRRGQFFWNGKKCRPKKVLTHSGVVLQNPIKYMFLPTVLDELTMCRSKLTPDDVRRVLRAVGLTDISLRASPQSLSGGQVRRLAIASQLLTDPPPDLLILDEPLAGVDWASRRALLHTLTSLKRRLAVMLVSHDPGELLSVADRVVEVSRGGIHDIDQAIIRRAVDVRAKKRSAQRNRAYREARQFHSRNDLDKERFL